MTSKLVSEETFSTDFPFFWNGVQNKWKILIKTDAYKINKIIVLASDIVITFM